MPPQATLLPLSSFQQPHVPSRLAQELPVYHSPVAAIRLHSQGASLVIDRRKASGNTCTSETKAIDDVSLHSKIFGDIVVGTSVTAAVAPFLTIVDKVRALFVCLLAGWFVYAYALEQDKANRSCTH